MKCKGCNRTIPSNSIYCNWCGMQQIKPANEIAVPKPKRLKNGDYSGQMMVSGRRLTVRAGSEAEYLAKARAIKADLIRMEKPENTLVSACVNRFIEERTHILSPSTLRNYRCIAASHFRGIQDMRISFLDSKIVQKAINEEARTYSPKTVRNAWMLISSAIKPYISIENIRLPTLQPKEPIIYDDELLSKLFLAVRGDDIELAVCLAACLGLRRSEILALKSESFNRKAGTITIAHARVPDENNELVEKTTKTRKSFRTLSCPAFIFDLVPDKQGYIYEEHKQNYILERLHRICERNGLPPVTLHGLRHSNASAMLKMMPDKYAMQRGGWSTNRTMKDIYQHTFDTEQAKYNAMMDEHFTRLFTAKLLPKAESD